MGNAVQKHPVEFAVAAAGALAASGALTFRALSNEEFNTEDSKIDDAARLY